MFIAELQELGGAETFGQDVFKEGFQRKVLRLLTHGAMMAAVREEGAGQQGVTDEDIDHTHHEIELRLEHQHVIFRALSLELAKTHQDAAQTGEEDGASLHQAVEVAQVPVIEAIHELPEILVAPFTELDGHLDMGRALFQVVEEGGGSLSVFVHQLILLFGGIFIEIGPRFPMGVRLGQHAEVAGEVAVFGTAHEALVLVDGARSKEGHLREGHHLGMGIVLVVEADGLVHVDLAQIGTEMAHLAVDRLGEGIELGVHHEKTVGTGAQVLDEPAARADPAGLEDLGTGSDAGIEALVGLAVLLEGGFLFLLPLEELGLVGIDALLAIGAVVLLDAVGQLQGLHHDALATGCGGNEEEVDVGAVLPIAHAAAHSGREGTEYSQRGEEGLVALAAGGQAFHQAGEELGQVLVEGIGQQGRTHRAFFGSLEIGRGMGLAVMLAAPLLVGFGVHHLIAPLHGFLDALEGVLAVAVLLLGHDFNLAELIGTVAVELGGGTQLEEGVVTMAFGERVTLEHVLEHLLIAGRLGRGGVEGGGTLFGSEAPGFGIVRREGDTGGVDAGGIVLVAHQGIEPLQQETELGAEVGEGKAVDEDEHPETAPDGGIDGHHTGHAFQLLADAARPFQFVPVIVGHHDIGQPRDAVLPARLQALAGRHKGELAILDGLGLFLAALLDKRAVAFYGQLESSTSDEFHPLLKGEQLDSLIHFAAAVQGSHKGKMFCFHTESIG